MPFERMILAEKEVLFRISLQILGNRQDAEDALSDFYIKVLEKKEQFLKYDNLKYALIRSIKNHCFNILKSRKIHENIEDIRLDLADEISNDRASDERLVPINRIIGKLPEKHRLLIHLRMVEEYSMKQIAEIMEEKVNTIEVAISRIRKKIRVEYEKQGNS